MQQTWSGPSLLLNVFLGVVSGVLAGVLSFLAIRGFWNFVVPFIQRIRYKGVAIRGEWEIENPHLAQTASVQLEQSAFRLKGSGAFISKEPDERDFDRLRPFVVEGTIEDGVVRLLHTHADPSRKGMGVFLLTVEGDARRLTGWHVYYGAMHGEIFASKVIFARPGVGGRSGDQFDIEKEQLAVQNAVLRARIEELIEWISRQGLPSPTPETRSDDPAQLELGKAPERP